MSVITAADVERAREVLVLAAADVITPLARDRAKELGVRLERAPSAPHDKNATKTADTPYARTRADSNTNTKSNTSPKQVTPRTNATREPAAGFPSAGIRLPQRGPSGAEPRSGVLYRRGGPAAPRAPARPTVAVVGAGHVGAAAGIRLAESDVFECVTLIDVVDGLAAGLALDMWHSAGLLGFTTRVVGSADVDAVAGADIVVITAGRPRKPGMTRTDLTAANAEIVRGIAATVRERAPNAVVVVVTNPLEEMTYLVAKITGFSPERVIGMGGVLDAARFASLVGLSGVAKPEDVRALVLGSHGAEMVVPLSQASANGIPLEKLLDAGTLADIVLRTRESGAEVTGLLKAGSAYLSPGSAIARQVQAIVSGSDDVVPACVASGGAYGIPDVRVGLPVRLGPRGIREIVELELRPTELRALREAAEYIRTRTAAVT